MARAMGVTLKLMVSNIDLVCQLAGSSLHAGIGTDLDRAFGKEQSLYDVDTISDLKIVPDMLAERGYNKKDVKNIMSGNWIRFLNKNMGKK